MQNRYANSDAIRSKSREIYIYQNVSLKIVQKTKMK